MCIHSIFSTHRAEVIIIVVPVRTEQREGEGGGGIFAAPSTPLVSYDLCFPRLSITLQQTRVTEQVTM